MRGLSEGAIILSFLSLSRQDCRFGDKTMKKKKRIWTTNSCRESFIKCSVVGAILTYTFIRRRQRPAALLRKPEMGLINFIAKGIYDIHIIEAVL